MSESDFNKIFSSNLKYYLEKNHLSQLDLAKKLNVSNTSVSNWCMGTKSPRMDKVDSICNLLNIKRSDLMEERTALKSTSTRAVRINVLGRVAAGIPIEAIEDIVDTEEISEILAKTGNFFGLVVEGDSMEPKISTGDVLIVRQQNDANSGDIVIVTVNGDNATCKRLKKYKDGIALISTNPKYEPMYYSNQEIEQKPVKVIGKVVELRAKL